MSLGWTDEWRSDQCLILRDSFAKTEKLTYNWHFRALRQSTLSELTWLIQLLFPTIATRWRPQRCWWRQKWIINMWQIVGPLVSIHSVRCSLSDPNSFSLETEVGSTKSILMKCSAWKHELVNHKSTFWFWQMNLLILFPYKPDESIQGYWSMFVVDCFPKFGENWK